MESSPESTITQAFNPFVPTQAIWGMGADGLIYEPLLQFDIAAPPKYYPWLATSYKWSNGGKTVTFTIRPGVKCNNGTPMTPADVVFTYNLVKTNKAINLAGLAISSVSTSGNTVTLTFPSAQYTNLQSIAGVPILPQAIWSKVGNPATYADANPVGTGPYKLKTFTPQGFTLTKNTGYWQISKVKVPNVYFPVYTSNTGALSALFSEQIDWTGNFIPGLQKDFVAKAPAYHHFWEAPGSTNAFIPNLNKWPTNQLAVRKAISLAVNRSLLASEGEAGLENPVLNASGITLPTYSAWGAPVASDTVSATGDAAAAQAVLKAAGYTKGSNGFFQKDGKTVSVTLISPAAYTDYAEVGSIAAQELKQRRDRRDVPGHQRERLERRHGRRQLHAGRALVQRRRHPVQPVRQLAGQLAGQRHRGHGRLRRAEEPGHRQPRWPSWPGAPRWPSRRPRSRRSRSSSKRTCRSSRSPRRRTGSSTTRSTGSAGRLSRTRTSRDSLPAVTTTQARAPTRWSSCT